MTARHAVVLALLGACGAPPSPPPASPPATSAPSESTEPSEPVQAPKPRVSEHVCAAHTEPMPCKNDIRRAGKFVDVPACLAILEPTVVGGDDASVLQSLLRDHADAIWACIAPNGRAPEGSGKILIVRVVRQPDEPASATLVTSDLDANAKRCMEGAVQAIPFPRGARTTSETTLRMAVVTRQWVDDPAGACPD